VLGARQKRQIADIIFSRPLCFFLADSAPWIPDTFFLRVRRPDGGKVRLLPIRSFLGDNIGIGLGHITTWHKKAAGRDSYHAQYLCPTRNIHPSALILIMSQPIEPAEVTLLPASPNIDDAVTSAGLVSNDAPAAPADDVHDRPDMSAPCVAHDGSDMPAPCVAVTADLESPPSQPVDPLPAESSAATPPYEPAVPHTEPAAEPVPVANNRVDNPHQAADRVNGKDEMSIDAQEPPPIPNIRAPVASTRPRPARIWLVLFCLVALWIAMVFYVYGQRLAGPHAGADKAVETCADLPTTTHMPAGVNNNGDDIDGGSMCACMCQPKGPLLPGRLITSARGSHCACLCDIFDDKITTTWEHNGLALIVAMGLLSAGLFILGESLFPVVLFLFLVLFYVYQRML
jgi:hypothetical protein